MPIANKALTTSTAQSKTAGTNNLTITPGTAFDVYDTIVVMVSWDPSGANVPTCTVSDGSNTYTAVGAQYPAPATTSAGTGVITQAFVSNITTALANPTITVTHSVSITAKSMVVYAFTGASATLRGTYTTARGTGTGTALTTPTANVGDVTIAFGGWEQAGGNTYTSDTDTTNGSWSTGVKIGTTGGNTATNITTAAQYKIQTTANSTQTFNGVMSASSNHSMQSFVLQPGLYQILTPTGFQDTITHGTPVIGVGAVNLQISGVKAYPNLCSNPGLDVDATGWSGQNGTLTRSTTSPYSGAGCGLLTQTALGTTMSAIFTVSGLTIGKSYEMSAWVKNSVGSARLVAFWTGVYGTSVSLSASWQQIKHTMVATATSHIIYITQSTATVSGDAFFFDEFVFSETGVESPAISRSIASLEHWGFFEIKPRPEYIPGYSVYLDASLPSSYPGSGTTWTDLSGNGRNGTLTSGPTYSAGFGAIVFDGTDDYVTGTIPTTTMSSFCMQGWVNITGGTNGGCFFKMGNNSGGIALGIGNTTMEDTGTNLVGLFPAVRWIPTTTSLGSGWKFVSMNMDASSVPTFYINGALVSGTYSGAAPAAPTTSYNLGRCIGDEGTGRQFQGQIGSFITYNRIVTAQEVMINFQRTRSKYGV